MSKTAGLNFVLMVALIAAVFASPANARTNDSDELISEKLLEKANLELVWENRIPLKNKERLDTLILAGDNLYCLSDKNYIIALNKDTGTFVFGRSYAPAGFPIMGIELYKGELFSVIGNNLVEIRTGTGAEVSNTPLDFGVRCPPQRNDSHFYIGAVDRRVHTLRAQDKVELFKFSADNDSAINSIVAGKEFIIFGTEKGNIVAVDADEPLKLWQFDARDAIAGELVRDRDSLFAASEDTNIYHIDIRDGNLIWKYQTSAMLDRAPRVATNVVYQYVWGQGLSAVHRTNGEFMWKLTEGRELLAENDGKAYVMAEKQTLIVMDNRERKQLYSVNFEGIDRFISNTDDSGIYVGNQSGHILCLRPVE